ncbi:MAG: hypothetical protein JXN61_02555 [Sedimentisphaerales bacterium]|nr:hypothetical protein [Sedimentisphaerales bacterium]
MAEADYDGSSQAKDKPVERIDDEFIPDDALPLCAKCLKPCNPLQYYCDKCGSYDAINPLTPYIPYVNIWFYFDLFLTMWRKVWGEGEKPIIIRLFYLLFLVAFYPRMLALGVPIYLICKIPQRQVRNVILAIFVLGLIALLIWYACSDRA